MSTYLVYQDGGVFDSQPQNMPGTEWRRSSSRASRGASGARICPITNCRLSNGQRLGIEEIRFGRTLPQMLVTALTLGFVGADAGQLALVPPAVQSGTLD